MKWNSPIFNELSGKLGGAVGTTTRGGVKVLRGLVIPANPNSKTQGIMRSIATALAAAWESTLSEAQRVGWRALGTGPLSGINAYQKSNTYRLMTGVARLDAPPASLALVYDPIVAGVIADATIPNVMFTVPNTNAEVRRVVFLSHQQNPSRFAQQKNYQFIGSTASDVAGTATIAIPSDHPAFALVAGKVVFVRIVAFGVTALGQTGRVGVAQEFRVVVQA